MWRVFFNLHKPELGKWVVDSGPGTQRYHVQEWSCMFARSGSTDDPTQHPKAWLEAEGLLTIENGHAHISP